MRIVTRPDFDGIVCAVLLSDIVGDKIPIIWAEPNAVQNRQVEIKEGDIIANLAYHENCSLWFDHHLSNQISRPFNGAFRIAPSAARVVFNYYKRKFKRDYGELVKETDKIDSANLSLDEVFHPENYAYISLDMTIHSQNTADESYWNRLVRLLGDYDISKVLDDSGVKNRIKKAIRKNKEYVRCLKAYSTREENVIITDFRPLKKTPSGNRFLIFCLFPEANVNVKIRYHDRDRDRVIVSVGHSIINRSCKVNSGKLCSRFSGGGHKGAGSCSFPAAQAEKNLAAILDTLFQNKGEQK
ncbi:MAG: exopolyphosphatase [Candidatus Aminicenantes bacterium]|nr:exopolyphosphatase [Candidatus Aminicenantes bacterium]